MYALNGRINAEDSANLEVEVAEATMGIARTLLCQVIDEELLTDAEVADLVVQVRIVKRGQNWGEPLYEKSMQVGKAYDVLVEEERIEAR